MKHSKIHRLMRILTTLQSGKGCTVDDLSRMFGASRRTIFRDLKELQDIGVPYRHDARTGVYTIAPEYFLPPADLNIEEALSLLLLAEKVSDQIQLPFRRAALQAALKIENNLPVEIRQHCSSVLRNISTRADVQASIRHNGRFDKIFAQLQEAVANRRKVNIRYNSLLDGGAVDLKLCPYHLLYDNGTWHVLGRSETHNNIHTFELNHISELKTTKECFLVDEEFDVSEYLGRAWSTMPEGQIYNVKLL
ncbi:MAG: WYL domain-containing protein, partial [Planctomycetota bacterium]